MINNFTLVKVFINKQQGPRFKAVVFSNQSYRLSYGLNFLAIDRDKPTLALLENAPGYKGKGRPELEGIGTNYLPAYTDLVKIR